MLAPFESIPALSASMIVSLSLVVCARVERTGCPARMDPGPEQGLIGIDVADPGDPPLVQQQRLDRRPAASHDRAQVRRP